MIKYINPAATHELVSHLVERIDALEAEIVALKMDREPTDPSGLLQASGLADIAAEQKRAKKAEYMREYMSRKRAEKREDA